MSATDELRRMLDERGVKWWNPVQMEGSEFTRWCDANSVQWTASEAHGSGKLRIGANFMTPEQAIAATLGSCNCSDNCTNSERTGTCHMRLVYEEEDADGFIWPDHYECDACGANVNGIMTSYDTEIQPRYCPNCGAKVVDK